MDMNMNVLWRDPDKVQSEQARRMGAFWGDDSWRKAAYRTDQNLFGFPEKTENDVIAEAFRVRLQDVAGFQYVPAPMPMRNTKGAVVYYLSLRLQIRREERSSRTFLKNTGIEGGHNGHEIIHRVD